MLEPRLLLVARLQAALGADVERQLVGAQQVQRAAHRPRLDQRRCSHSSVSTSGGSSTRAHSVSCAEDITWACRPQMSEITASGSVARSAPGAGAPRARREPTPTASDATLGKVLRLRVALVARRPRRLRGHRAGRCARSPPTTTTSRSIPTPPGAERGEAVADPFAWTPKRSADLTPRAAAGTAHLLYTRSPGGVAVTAERVARFRAPIERAAKAAGVDPDRLEALVFLESAGRPEAQAPGGVASAAGLTQILAETATGLLGMKVDQAKSASYTRRLEQGAARGQPAAGGGAEPRAAARRRPLRPGQGARPARRAT